VEIARDTVVYQGVASTFQQPVKAVGIGGWDLVPYFDADLLHLKVHGSTRNDVLVLEDCYVMIEFSDGL